MEYPPESIGNCGIYEENVERDGCFGDLGWAWGDLRCGPFPGCRLSGSLMAFSYRALLFMGLLYWSSWVGLECRVTCSNLQRFSRFLASASVTAAVVYADSRCPTAWQA
jgi:hypothetical protein